MSIKLFKSLCSGGAILKFNKKKVLLVVALFFTYQRAVAYSPVSRAREAYEIKSGNGEYIFYMNPGPPSSSDLERISPCRKDEFKCIYDEALDLIAEGNVLKGVSVGEYLCESKYKPACELQNEEKLKDYLPSGLYRNVDNELSGNPLWMVDFYARKVFLSNDGQALVVPGGRASSPDDVGVSFYRQGEKIKSYKVLELYDSAWLYSRSLHGFSWTADTRYLPDEEKYYIQTSSGKEYYFDIYSGRIIRTYKGVLRSVLRFFLGS